MKYSTILFAIIFYGCASTVQQKEPIKLSGGEEYRPAYHFTPPAQWMNDPNGMVYFEGEYHLFYQHFPDSNVWGPMHWGHAVSENMITWEHLPIALYPDSLGYIFSGSAVIDWQNTSGFGTRDNPPMVAIYTYHDPVGADARRIDFQTQGIAYSLDKGRSWTKYQQNPILDNPGIIDFRDPKVSWNEEFQQWTMILAVKDHVNIYSSPDLKEWKLESEFGQSIGAHGGVWECPDLFPLTDENETEKWVMLVSINPGGPQGGSATQYFVGDFDGSVFTPGDSTIRWVDYGADNYAGVTWSDVPESDGRRLFLGWMSNWQYAVAVPTDNWRSAMTLPRELKLLTINDQPVLQSVPVEELGEHFETSSSIDSGGQLESAAYKLELSNIPESGLELIFENNIAEKLTISLSKDELLIDRTSSGLSDFNDLFASVHKAPLPDVEIEKLQIFMDKSSIEVFVNDGLVVMTDLMFPNEVYTSISFTEGLDVKMSSLKSDLVEL